MDCENGTCTIQKNINDKSIDIQRPNNNTEWTVYGGDWCGFCKGAKRHFKNLKIDYTYLNVDIMGGASNVRDKLRDIIGNHSTVPIIFHYTYFVGGYTELKIYLKSNEYIKTKNIKMPGNLCGGTSDAKDADSDITEMCNNLKETIEMETGETFAIFEPVHYLHQVVAGMNYFVNVKVDDDKYLHFRLYKSLKGDTQFVRHLFPKKKDDELKYF